MISTMTAHKFFGTLAVFVLAASFSQVIHASEISGTITSKTTSSSETTGFLGSGNSGGSSSGSSISGTVTGGSSSSGGGGILLAGTVVGGTVVGGSSGGGGGSGGGGTNSTFAISPSNSSDLTGTGGGLDPDLEAFLALQARGQVGNDNASGDTLAYQASDETSQSGESAVDEPVDNSELAASVSSALDFGTGKRWVAVATSIGLLVLLGYGIKTLVFYYKA